MKTKLLNNLQNSNKYRNVILFLIISILIFLNEINLINTVLFNNNIIDDIDSIKKFRYGIIAIVYILQFIATFITIGLETFLICIITKIIYKKTNPLKIFLEPIMISNIMCLIINYIFWKISGSFENIQDLKVKSIFSPANLLQPIVICYFLSKKNIIPKNVIDWLKIGGIYITAIGVPAIILFMFI